MQFGYSRASVASHKLREHVSLHVSALVLVAVQPNPYIPLKQISSSIWSSCLKSSDHQNSWMPFLTRHEMCGKDRSYASPLLADAH